MRGRRSLALVIVYIVLGATWGGACAASGDDLETEASSVGATSAGGAGSSTGGAASTVGSGANGGAGAGATGGGGAAVTTGSSGGGTGGATSSSTASGSGGMANGSGGFGGACAAVSAQAQTAPVPADIIIAVDTSGSMDLESGEVQQNLNDFASIITSSGIDVHVVLIADGSVCIPAPLGSGNCASDEQLPAYRHVLVGVASNDALEKIVSTYPQYSASLRPEATKTFLVVSDDDSTSMTAAQFTSQIVAADPTFQGFKFDAIVSFENPVTCEANCLLSGCMACGKCCPFCVPLSAAEGTVYKQLVQQTGGVIGDLCDQDFDAVFQDMATQIVVTTPIACDFDIPPPPNMMALDPTKVNVVYTPGGMGNPQTIPNVADQAACGALGGWYYDDPANPTKVVLCPATCTVISGDPSGQLDVAFGCETIHI